MRIFVRSDVIPVGGEESGGSSLVLSGVSR